MAILREAHVLKYFLCTEMSNTTVYSIPSSFRKVENLHILFWLIKDACWAMNFKLPALIMIIPTMVVALLITWQTRHMKSELYHNLAIVFWITANCTWMVGEFFKWDENLWNGMGLRQFAVVPFALGLGILAYYYIVYKRKQSSQSEEKIYIQTAKEDIEDMKVSRSASK
jgi:hypothetical protein